MPNKIKPIDPVLLIKTAALFGLPAIYNPQPTIASTPPGMSGHQIKLEVMVRERIVINNQPRAKPTSMIPVRVKYFDHRGFPTPDK